MSDIRLLNLPLNKDVVKTQNFGGRRFDYVEASTVGRILNATMEKWDFTIIDKESETIGDFDVIFTVHGRLTCTERNPANGELSVSTKEYIASSSLRGSSLYGDKKRPGINERALSELVPQDFQPKAVENIWKATTTDCLKKCASQFGVAVELYGDDVNKPVFKFTFTEKQLGQLKGFRDKGMNDDDVNYVVRSANLGRGLHDIHDYNVEAFIASMNKYLSDIKGKL